MPFYFNENTTIEHINRWFVDELSISEYRENYESDDEDNKLSILSFMIKKNKLDVAEYLINLGISYKEEDILKSKDINFIKKYIDLTNIKNEYLSNKTIYNYLIENDLLNNENIWKCIYRCKDKKEQYELIVKYINKLTKEQIISIAKDYLNLDTENDYDHNIKVFKFLFKYLKETCQDIDFTFVFEKIKSWFKGDIYDIYYIDNNKMTKQEIFIMEVVHLALENNILDPNLKTYKDESRTLFMEALKLKFPASELELLIQKGADINYLDKDNNNYLSYCYTAEQTKFLLSKGVDAKIINNSNKTPLFHVRQVEQVKMLIDAGVDVNIVSKDNSIAYESFMNIYNQRNQHNVNVFNDNTKKIADEIFKYMLDIKKITNPDTKLSELTLNDLVAILRYKGVKI